MTRWSRVGFRALAVAAASSLVGCVSPVVTGLKIKTPIAASLNPSTRVVTFVSSLTLVNTDEAVLHVQFTGGDVDRVETRYVIVDSHGHPVPDVEVTRNMRSSLGGRLHSRDLFRGDSLTLDDIDTVQFMAAGPGRYGVRAEASMWMYQLDDAGNTVVRTYRVHSKQYDLMLE